MRALLSAALVFTALAGCDQDFAASNADRQTFMGNARAAAPTAPPSASAPASAPPPAAVAVPNAATAASSTTAVLPAASSSDGGVLLPRAPASAPSASASAGR